MPKTIEYHNPDFEDDRIFDVGGLAIPNGGSVTLSEEEELAFFSKKQMSVSDFFAGDRLIKVSGKSELSKSVVAAHTGKDVNAIADSLDDDVTPPEDDDNEVETDTDLANDEEVTD